MPPLPGPRLTLCWTRWPVKTWTFAVVHGDREVDGELALRDAQHAAHAVIEVELVGGVVELGLGDGPDVRSLRHRVRAGHQVR